MAEVTNLQEEGTKSIRETSAHGRNFCLKAHNPCCLEAQQLFSQALHCWLKPYGQVFAPPSSPSTYRYGVRSASNSVQIHWSETALGC